MTREHVVVHSRQHLLKWKKTKPHPNVLRSWHAITLTWKCNLLSKMTILGLVGTEGSMASILTGMSSAGWGGDPQNSVLHSSYNPAVCGPTKAPQQKHFPFLMISTVIDHLSHIWKAILHDHFWRKSFRWLFTNVWFDHFCSRNGLGKSQVHSTQEVNPTSLSIQVKADTAAASLGKILTPAWNSPSSHCRALFHTYESIILGW